MRYAGLLLLFGVERIVELLYSKRNERSIAHREPNAPEAARSVFKWIAALHLALFTLPALEHRVRHRRVPPAAAAIGWLAAISATVLRLSVVAALRSEWNIRAIVPSDLRVTDRGPYRWIRHPNYVALALEFAGLPLIGGAYVSAALLSAANGILLAQRIAEEDKLLMAIPAYRERMGDKPRFIPHLVSAR